MSGSVPMNRASLRAILRASLLVSLLLALAAAKPALAAAPTAGPGRAEVESLVREAAQLEKTDCEAAYPCAAGRFEQATTRMAGASGQNDSYRTLLRGLKFLWSLRQEMSRGMPILDKSPQLSPPPGGYFLRAERNLLESHGWKFDTSTKLWIPPGK